MLHVVRTRGLRVGRRWRSGLRAAPRAAGPPRRRRGRPAAHRRRAAPGAGGACDVAAALRRARADRGPAEPTLPGPGHCVWFFWYWFGCWLGLALGGVKRPGRLSSVSGVVPGSAPCRSGCSGERPWPGPIDDVDLVALLHADTGTSPAVRRASPSSRCPARRRRAPARPGTGGAPASESCTRRTSAGRRRTRRAPSRRA